MNHPLANLIAERVSSGLTRKALRRCSEWAETYRVMGKPYPGPWRFIHHPWLRDMHDSEAQLNVGQKAAQMGYSETLLNIVFYNMDIKGNSCLYILPSQNPDASQFSTSRFDPALQLSPHLTQFFSDVKNVGHKRAGSANLYIRGSRSESGLKSVPAAILLLDELDEMDQDNIPLAFERSSGQVEKLSWEVSTPKIDKTGINREYLRSSENHFFFPCPHCSMWIELIFPECMVITAEDENDPEINNTHLICNKCHAKLIHEDKKKWLAKGSWIEGHTGRDIKGWHISQLYSTTVSPKEFATGYLRSLIDKSAEQQFYNSKLGVTHSVKGSKITDEEINDRLGNYPKQIIYVGNNIVTMGVDVGSRIIHFEIDEWFLPSINVSLIDLNSQSRCRVLTYGTLHALEELDSLMYDFKVSYCVIDANPERRKAYEFSTRFWGRVRLCFFTRGIQGKSIHLADEPEPKVNVDRTSWLDLSTSRFHVSNRITLPYDNDVEYRNHMKALTRVYETDVDGNPVGRYLSTDDDHYAHARNYAEIALPLAASISATHDIGSVL